MSNKLTLHEAIERLLLQEGRCMSTGEIAEALNENQWYRKKDGSKIQPFQIHGRTRNYAHLFDRDGAIVCLSGKGTLKKADVDKLQIPVPAKEKLKEDILTFGAVSLPAFSGTTEQAIMDELLDAGKAVSVGTIDGLVPDKPGMYLLRIVDSDQLPKAFREHHLTRGHDIIYIGIATKSLRRRMLQQELRAVGHGTLFRSMGAMLGFQPPKGSLVDNKNKRNYTFSEGNKVAIIEWANRNLFVNWVISSSDLGVVEKRLIGEYRPILNLDHNPEALGELRRLRRECRRVALS